MSIRTALAYTRIRTGRTLVAIGFVGTFAALPFELVSLSLSGLAVRVTLVISGFLMMIARSPNGSTST